MDIKSKIYVAGHNGMVGSAIIRKLELSGFTNIIFRSSRKLDLRDQNQVKVFLKEKPEYVFLSAAKVGGILANNNFPLNLFMII